VQEIFFTPPQEIFLLKLIKFDCVRLGYAPLAEMCPVDIVLLLCYFSPIELASFWRASHFRSCMGFVGPVIFDQIFSAFWTGGKIQLLLADYL
jgi:hypothetical protein